MNRQLAKLKKYNIILATRSPRRHMLMKGLDLNFEVKVKNTKENFPPEMPVDEVPVFLSKQKAAAFDLEKLQNNDLIITADTIVVLGGLIIGKPTNKQHAIEILQLLSGKQHTVYTGITITSKSRQHSFVSESKVTFKTLDQDAIEFYVEEYNPMDKAGAYGIQEWIGYVGIESIEGSFYNVMGLPTQKLYEELLNFVNL
jgi:septum formation protein